MTTQDANLRDANDLLASCLSLVDSKIIKDRQTDLERAGYAQNMLLHAQIHLLKQTSLYAPIQRVRP